MPPFIIEVMPNTEETHARLAEIPNLTVSTATPLSLYTRFGIGGPADLYAETGSVEAFIAALAAARSSGIQTMVIGGGTNLIVSDRGFRGIVLRFRADRLLAANSRVMADAGAVLQDLVDFSIAHGLKGLETLSGIPGSVGGELKMNAGGAFGDIGSSVETVTVMDTNGHIFVREKDDLVFEYRKSNITAKFILGAMFQLSEDDPQRIMTKVKEIWMYKKNSQPLADKSAGCIFKNPRGLSAGALIDQSGMKGSTMGGAEVSTKHANFITAKKGARAADVLGLIDLVKQRVKEKFDVKLETEVVI